MVILAIGLAHSFCYETFIMIPALLILYHVMTHVYQFFRVMDDEMSDKNRTYEVIMARAKLGTNCVVILLSIS